MNRTRIVLVSLAAVILAAVVLEFGRWLLVTRAFDPPSAVDRTSAIGSTVGLSPRLRRVYDPAMDFELIAEPGPDDWLANHAEKGQTFDEFRASKPNRPSGRRRTIYLQPIGAFDSPGAPSLDDLRRYAAAFFALDVRVLPRLEFDGERVGGVEVRTRVNGSTRRRQILTGDVLELLADRLSKDAFCLLGITMEDLYPEEGWNYVFGQATLRKRVGIYSFARYDPRFWNERPRKNESVRRLRRSAGTLVHETAHMFGMHHCIYFSCVENGSNNLEEADRHPLRLCPVCLRKLADSTGLDPVERYRKLGDVSRHLGLLPEAEWIEKRLKTIEREPRPRGAVGSGPG